MYFLLQTAGIFFQTSFLTSADSAGVPLLGPLMQILSLGLSAAAVTNYVQSVSECYCNGNCCMRCYMPKFRTGS